MRRYTQDVIFLHALTPLSPGTGTTVDVIDQPVAREKATTLPFLPGATLKGVLRAGLKPPESQAAECALWRLAFGPEGKDAPDHAGALVFNDARLLLLPVRSERGVFAWATSPFVLRRFRRDLPETAALPAFPDQIGQESVVLTKDSALRSGRSVVLEELELKEDVASNVTELAQWLAARILDQADRRDFEERLAILSDEAFTFLGQTATEVVARIRIKDETRTVDQGGLWYEEALPAETMLSCFVLAYPGRRPELEVAPEQILSMLNGIHEGTWTMGGKETIGRGRVRLRRLEAQAGGRS